MTAPTDFRETVRVHREQIAALRKLPITEARCREICDLYEPLIEPAAETLTELDVLLDYSIFLFDQELNERGLSVAERLQQCYDSPAAQISNAHRSMLLNLLGVFRLESDPAQAEDCFRRGMALCAEHVGAETEAGLAWWKCSLNLARLLSDSNRAEAEALYQAGLSTIRQLAERSEQEYGIYFAKSCNNMAVLMYKEGKPDAAEPLYREALAVYRRLCTDASTCRYDYASTCVNLAGLLFQRKESEEAISLLREAHATTQQLAKEWPARFAPTLALYCGLLAYYLLNCYRPQQAEQLLLQAMEIFQKAPERYVTEIADTLHNLAAACHQQQKKVEAKAYYEKALAHRRSIYDRSPREGTVPLARLCYEYGVFQLENNRFSPAEKLLEESIRLCRTAVAEGHDDAELTLGICLQNRGALALQLMQKRKAEAYIREALSILKKYPQMKDNTNNLQNTLNQYFQPSPARKLWDRLTGKNRTS